MVRGNIRDKIINFIQPYLTWIYLTIQIRRVDMADNGLISKITDIVIQQTVNQKIPTVIFLSDIDKGSLLKNVISKLYGSDENIFADYSFTPWEKVAEIMRNLAEIPLLLKETFDIKEIKTGTKNFIAGMEGEKGLVIINSKEKISATDFTTDENIIIMII